MNVRYITIEREFGSGGTKIASEVSKTCGIPCYGHAVLETVAKEQNVSVQTLEDYEESVSGSFLYSMFVMAQSQTGDPDLLSPEAKLYVAETRVIRRLADQQPCIFLGHCASEALKEVDGVLRVFIRASEEDKEKRVIHDYGVPEKQVAAVCRKVNRRRANYYSFCTRKKWSDLSNYDVVLDSTNLGIEQCAAALSAMYLNP